MSPNQKEVVRFIVTNINEHQAIVETLQDFLEENMSWKAKRFVTKHHNFAKSRGGNGHGHKGSEDYLTFLSAEHHQLFHKLFGNSTLREAAEILLRLDRLKKEAS